jgi:hypothetical protein
VKHLTNPTDKNPTDLKRTEKSKFVDLEHIQRIKSNELKG